MCHEHLHLRVVADVEQGLHSRLMLLKGILYSRAFEFQLKHGLDGVLVDGQVAPRCRDCILFVPALCASRNAVPCLDSSGGSNIGQTMSAPRETISRR